MKFIEFRRHWLMSRQMQDERHIEMSNKEFRVSRLHNNYSDIVVISQLRRQTRQLWVQLEIKQVDWWIINNYRGDTILKFYPKSFKSAVVHL